MSSVETEVTAANDSFPNVKISKIINPLLLGEGPHWDIENKLLYFVDLMGKAVHRYNPANREHKKLTFNRDVVTFIIPVRNEKNEFVISLGREIARLSWDGYLNNLKYLTTVIGNEGPDVKTRLNDAKADHLGNLWLGTMFRESQTEDFREKQGALYRYDANGTLAMIVDGVGISNGITWNKNKDKMFYVDSVTRRVDVFDYDKETGTAMNRRRFFDFAKKRLPGIPDGITTDCEDNLWIACWDASKVLNVSSRTGIVLGVLTFPCSRITSCIFGGEKLDKLYVTSAKYGLTEQQLKEQPLAGAVFCVEGLGVYGNEAHSAVVPPGVDYNKKKSKEQQEDDKSDAKAEDNSKENYECQEADSTQRGSI